MSQLVLLSGGLDSAVMLWRASAPVGLFINYGQPAALQESGAARALAMARGCGLEFAIVSLRLGDMSAPEGEEGPRVVPGRNLALLSIAANYASAVGADEVWIGAHHDDSQDYPDCRPGFMHRANTATQMGCGVTVKAPLLDSRKAHILHEAHSLGVPVALCWSCYTPTADGRKCKTCNSCRAY